MNKEDSIRFAGLMEDYLNIPSFVCEMIQQQLEENKYKEVVEYVIQRRNEIENKEDYVSQQQAIKMWINKLEEQNKEIYRLNNIIDELEKWVKERIDNVKYNDYDDMLDKLKELKEGNNENNNKENN